MPTFCSVCSSSQQAVIDRRLLDGESLATLSADYGLPVREIRHHRDDHVLQRGRSTDRGVQRPSWTSTMARGRASAAGRKETPMKESTQASRAFFDCLAQTPYHEYLSQSK
jgi:hypothetical protein